MGRFTVIPQNAFDALQLDAGVLLYNFDIEAAAASKTEAGFTEEDLICATTGGINVVCQPTYSDFAEDVDNAPNNLKEFKHLDGWNCTMATTSIGTSAESIRLQLGAADIDSENSAIVPRRDLKQRDFTDIWWVGDKANGGFVAVQLKNALSSEGFSLQTSKNAKGQIGFTLTGHVSLAAQAVVPMIFYSIDEEEANYNVTQTLTHVTSSYTDTTVEEGESLKATLAAESGYTISSVTVTMGGTDITAAAYNSTSKRVSIMSVTGDVVITAVAVEGT